MTNIDLSLTDIDLFLTSIDLSLINLDGSEGTELYVNSLDELDTLLLANGVLEANLVSTWDAIWPVLIDPDTSLAYASAEAAINQIYNQGGILKTEIVAAIPVEAGPPSSAFVAAYDFNDETDSHGSLDLVETTAPPSYSGGYGISVDTTDEAWTQASLGASFMNTDADWSMVYMFEGKTGIINGDYIFYSNGARIQIRWITAGIRVTFGSVTYTTAVVPSVDNKYALYVEHDATSSELLIDINGTVVSGIDASSATFGSGASTFGGSSTTSTTDLWHYYANFFNRKLTQDEREYYTLSTADRDY